MKQRFHHGASNNGASKPWHEPYQYSTKRRLHHGGRRMALVIEATTGSMAFHHGTSVRSAIRRCVERRFTMAFETSSRSTWRLRTPQQRSNDNNEIKSDVIDTNTVAEEKKKQLLVDENDGTDKIPESTAIQQQQRQEQGEQLEQHQHQQTSTHDNGQ